MSVSERRALALIGAAALAAMALLAWQRRTPPLVVVGSLPVAPSGAWDDRLRAARQVDVNTAGAAELERLPEIGPSLARRIVEYRSAHGPFRNPEELSQVPGIGPKTLEALEEYLTTK